MTTANKTKLVVAGNGKCSTGHQFVKPLVDSDIAVIINTGAAL